MGHTHKQMTEEETAQEVAKTTENAFEAIDRAGLTVASTLEQQYAVQAIAEKHGVSIEVPGKTTEGVFETKAGAVFDYSISPDGKTVTIKGTDRGSVKSFGDGDVIDNIPDAIQPKKKRGRPKGSKNKPKTNA